MTSIEAYKISMLYDYKMSLTNGVKQYTFDKARDFAFKFCDKHFSTNEKDIVKSLISKNILIKFDLPTGLEKGKHDDFIKQHYSQNVVKFMEIIENDKDKNEAYDLLETLDDWIAIYQFIIFARLYNKLFLA